MRSTNSNISVIIPAYNSESTISACLNALKEQTVLPDEIIVVDDGSEDQTAKVAQGLALVIGHALSKGASGARNSGAKIARSGILAFIDSDCIAPKDWLKNISMAFSNPQVLAVGGGYSSGVERNFWQRFCFEELAFRRRNLHGEVKTLVGNNFACRKSVFLEVGGFAQEYPVCEDILLSYKISQQGKVLWLKDNGVQHHFKNSLKAYIKHQFFFAAQSVRFFLKNPKLLLIKNHQGKSLHLAVILAFTSCLSVILGLFNFAVLLLLGHFFLYIAFLRHLARAKFPRIFKAYGVSLLRDLVCSFAAIPAIVRKKISYEDFNR